MTPRADPQNEQTKKPNKPRHASQKANDEKKKSYRRSWRSTSPVRKIEIILGAIVAAGAIGYLGVTVWGNLQTKWNFTAEHRPKVIVNRPPELLGTVECEVTDKAIHLHTGSMHIYVKNLRKGDASGAFAEGPMFKLVPNNKIGIPFYDDLPIINDETCKQQISPKMKAFPVRGGEEVRIDMVQSAGTVSLVKTKSVSVTFGGAQQEPATPPGEKEEKVSISKDAIFQLYAPVCVYYFGEDGTRYGSCRNYRFAISGRTGSDNYSFSCTQTPLSGTFEETFFGYCEN